MWWRKWGYFVIFPGRWPSTWWNHNYGDLFGVDCTDVDLSSCYMFYLFNMLKTMLELSVLTSTCYIFDHICSIKLSLWYCSLLGGSIRPVVFPRDLFLAPCLCNTRFKRTTLACLLKELYSGKIQLNSDCVGKRTTPNGLQLYVCVRSRDKTAPILPSPTPVTQ